MTQDEINRARRLAELPEEWQKHRILHHETVTHDVYPGKQDRVRAFDDFLLDLWGRVNV
jgi:hypothetical protein